MTPAAPTIHIVDDDDSLRTALARLLTASGYLTLTHVSARAFLAAPIAPGPQCILLDVDMPGLSGFELQEHLNSLDRVMPIVFLTGHGDIAMGVRAIKRGAEDFLSKPVQSIELLGAIERAISRYYVANEEQTHLQGLRRRVATLTAREHEVFSLVVLGLLNKQIAHALGNTERTVKAHRHSLMAKMQVDSLAELVLLASRLGMLERTATDVPQ